MNNKITNALDYILSDWVMTDIVDKVFGYKIDEGVFKFKCLKKQYIEQANSDKQFVYKNFSEKEYWNSFTVNLGDYDINFFIEKIYESKEEMIKLYGEDVNFYIANIIFEENFKNKT